MVDRRSWTRTTGHDGIARMVCTKSNAGLQTVCKFQVAEELTAFHDEGLARATETINSILEDVKKSNKDRNRELSVLNVPQGLFLAWTTYNAVGPNDDDATIESALGVR